MEVCMMRYSWTALCVVVLAMSVKSEEAPKSFQLTLDISNRIYNDSLLKPDSPDYKLLFSEVNTTLYSIYGCATCNTHSFYHKVSEMTFSNETGSVLVNATLVFQTMQTDADAIKDLFLKAIADTNEINNLKINPKFTQVIALSSPESPASSTSHPHKTPTDHPAAHPTDHPAAHPTTHPTDHPAAHPTTHPTDHPAAHATDHPAAHPTTHPTDHPAAHATDHPAAHPTTHPTDHPAAHATDHPAAHPTTHPTDHPAAHATTKHHNAAASFNQTPMSLMSFLRYSASFCLLFCVNYSI